MNPSTGSDGTALSRATNNPQPKPATILVVDDEPALGELMGTMLSGLGYRVLIARNARAALEVARTFPAKIDLLIADFKLPDSNGRKLAAALKADRPETKVLFMSGYEESIVMDHTMTFARDLFVEKPFTPGVMAQKIREVLHTP